LPSSSTLPTCGSMSRAIARSSVDLPRSRSHPRSP
jgi:hypothetical protein